MHEVMTAVSARLDGARPFSRNPAPSTGLQTSASAGLQTSTQQAELLRLTRGILNDPAVQAAVLACAELRDYAQGLRNSGLLGPAPAPLALPLAVNKNVSLQEVEGANGPGPGQQLAELLNELRLLVGGALNALTAVRAGWL